MNKQKFELSNAQRTLLKAFCKKKWLKKTIEKPARKIRYSKEPSEQNPPADSRSSVEDATKIKKEVIDLTTTKTSVDEFLDITERQIGHLFYQDLPAEKPRELRDRCKKIDDLVVPLILKLTPEHLALIGSYTGEDTDHFKPALESLRDANHNLLDAFSTQMNKDKLGDATEELTTQLANAYQQLFDEKPTSKNKFYDYLGMALDLIGNDFDHKIKISSKRVNKILKKSF